MQYLIYFSPLKKRKIVTKLWDLKTHKSTWELLECQVNNLAIQWDKTVDS